MNTLRVFIGTKTFKDSWFAYPAALCGCGVLKLADQNRLDPVGLGVCINLIDERLRSDRQPIELPAQVFGLFVAEAFAHSPHIRISSRLYRPLTVRYSSQRPGTTRWETEPKKVF